MKLIKLSWLFVCFLAAINLAAQTVASPDFLCIGNDSLRWNNITNNCGSFQGTVVFRANDIAGPYTEIATLNNPSLTAFSDPNPLGELRFYYLSYRYDCPGANFLNSDTINNLIPLPPSAVWVSVENGAAVINWTASSSPQTAGYRIFRREPQGLMLIATTNNPNQLSYIDNSFANQPESESYSIAAIDVCENQSLLVNQVFGQEILSSTLSLSGGNACTSVITITTDAPDVASVPLPIIGWELFVSTNGAPFLSSGSFGAGNSFEYNQANDGENVCFYLEGQIQGQPDRPIRTPTQCTDVAIIQPVRPFRLLGGGYDATGNFCLDFDWDELAAIDLLQANINDAGSQTSTLAIDFADFTGNNVEFCAPLQSFPTAPFNLSLRAEDVCDNIVLTNRLSPTFLTGTSTNTSNQLSWTAFDSEQDISINYQLERTALDGTTSIVYNGSDLNFTDQIDATDANLGIACYRVLTTVTYASDGFISTYASQTVCLEQSPMIYLPNAFSPEATMVLNREFCPGFARLPTGTYQLNIWDRWGGHVFSTNDPSTCWDGNYRGRIAESGTYLYTLYLEIGNRKIEHSGSLNLIR